MDDEDRAVRPNSQFLGRLLTGVQSTNQRAIDTNAIKAAQKARGGADVGREGV